MAFYNFRELFFTVIVLLLRVWYEFFLDLFLDALLDLHDAGLLDEF
jgi:hypothetical protein